MWCIGICIGRCVTCIHLECSLQSYLGTYVGSIFMKICSCNFVLTTNIERQVCMVYLPHPMPSRGWKGIAFPDSIMGSGIVMQV